MELGMVGLGRMGAGLAQRLIRASHRVVGFDPDAGARQRAVAAGLATADSLASLVSMLAAPRAIWMMVPAGAITEGTVEALGALLGAGDTLIDGGNSSFHDTQRRGKMLAARNIQFVDCGTSGGIWGLRRGFSLMVGGEQAAVERLRPIFAALAPDAEAGWGHVGPCGSGHYVKMIHNGIEYGLMQAYAEGFAILQRQQQFNADLRQIAEIWNHGSVVQSWLLERTSDALNANPTLAGIAPYVADSGEGRWTVAEAIELGISAPVITLALLERLRSRDAESFAAKLLAAMRHEFGGHDIKPE